MSQYYEQELDFNGARADLDSVLQDIVAKANAHDDNEEPNTSNDTEFEGHISLTHDKTKHLLHSSELDSPKKGGFKLARKRKRKEDLKEERHKVNSCVTKLFERSVDLAQFSEDTPLFPICRAWMANDPYKEIDNAISLSEKIPEIFEGAVFVPPPDKPFNNFTPDGRYISPRIPSPPAQPKDDLESYLKGGKPVPRAETLLIDNLQHWKMVREKWRAKSVENEHRYSTGMNMLKTISANQTFTS